MLFSKSVFSLLKVVIQIYIFYVKLLFLGSDLSHRFSFKLYSVSIINDTIKFMIALFFKVGNDR